jgi:hypothetical protein
VRRDPAIGEQVLAFLKTYAPRSTVVTDGIIGCPHEKDTDHPEGLRHLQRTASNGGRNSPMLYSADCHISPFTSVTVSCATR